jgi:hypothetical protein
MTYGGKSLRDDTQQLRDIQNIIAELNDVNKRLSGPIRTVPAAAADAGTAEAEVAAVTA